MEATGGGAATGGRDRAPGDGIPARLISLPSRSAKTRLQPGQSAFLSDRAAKASGMSRCAPQPGQARTIFDSLAMLP